MPGQICVLLAQQPNDVAVAWFRWSRTALRECHSAQGWSWQPQPKADDMAHEIVHGFDYAYDGRIAHHPLLYDAGGMWEDTREA